MPRLLLLLLIVGCMLLAFGVSYGLLIRIVIRSRKTSDQPVLRRGAWLAGIAAIYPLILLVLSLQHGIVPQRHGILALTQVLAPYLFLPLLLLVPFAFVPRAVVLRTLLIACLIVFSLRFFPSLHFGTPSRAASQMEVTVLNWNVHPCCGAERQAARVRPVLATKPAEVVVLQEAYWEWLRQDPTISTLYPHQYNHTPQASTGLVLLSSFPVVEHGVAEVPREARGWPRLVWARLDVGQGQTLLVVAAHPEGPYSFVGRCRVPPCYDTSQRDSLLPHIRAVVDPALQRGEHLLLVGDMNTTEREPAYRDLSRGLVDAHHRVGSGWGHTWGVIPEIGWNLPFLRIEYLFGSPNVAPLQTTVDCSPRGSDHCMLNGRFVLN